MRRIISVLCLTIATALPAAAFYVGFTYEDGSDAIFEMSPNIREVFETTLSEQLERLGSEESEIATFKGLAHPLYPNGETNTGYICGLVKGFGETTGREFVPFYYMRNGADFHARIVQSDSDRAEFDKRGCNKALGL